MLCTSVPLSLQNDQLSDLQMEDDSSGIATDPPAIPPIHVHLQLQTISLSKAEL